ncbi:hypothetical protein [Litorilituus sediminis]|uniref:RiboL-PSP-HEPN domain-containing protein n=1 Tax=Litorilituus sediminis TaxID=718192 RepID=A0A4P6P4W1_9GAMM|nr:hypothetical protein [Litorilituus sediminis]QBG36706.1 hypothetical protein EMK97_13750 [Litorilituus sediminis]
MSNWKLTVSAPASTVSMGNISDYLNTQQAISSPIDSFYKSRNELLAAITPAFAGSHANVVSLVLVGLISCTENYFREVMSGIIAICPKAKEKSAQKTVNLATAWFGYGNIEKGAFENTSFSDKKAITDNLKNFIGYEIKKNNQLVQPLEEFARLCEMRHAIVHSSGLLAGKNAIKLNLPSSKDAVKIELGFAELQEAAEICTSLVCSSNIELFSYIGKRWLHEWPSTPAYSAANMNELFKKVWRLFFSEIDNAGGRIQNTLSPIKTRNLLSRTNAA